MVIDLYEPSCNIAGNGIVIFVLYSSHGKTQNGNTTDGGCHLGKTAVWL